MDSIPNPDVILNQDLTQTVEQPFSDVLTGYHPFRLERHEFEILRSGGGNWLYSIPDDIVATGLIAALCQLVPFLNLLRESKAQEAYDTACYGLLSLLVLVVAMLVIRGIRWKWPSRKDELMSAIEAHFKPQPKTLLKEPKKRAMRSKESGVPK